MSKAALTEVRIPKLPDGKYGDGRGLYLRVRGESRAWAYRYKVDGKDLSVSLGVWPYVTLDEARIKAIDMGRLRANGGDPASQRRATIAAGAFGTKTRWTIREAVAEVIRIKSEGWKASSKSRQQWEGTFRDHVFPRIGEVDVSDITPQILAATLEPIWVHKVETAAKVRQRLEGVMEWAIARGLHAGPNPAALAALETLLTSHLALRRHNPEKRVQAHAALEYADLPAFMQALREEQGGGARALELTIATGSRTKPILLARWQDFDLDAGLWVIPDEDMKASRQHVAVLPPQTVDMLRGMGSKSSGLVFPSPERDEQGREKPLSNGGMPSVLRRMKREDITVHGMRATMRTWGAECTDHDRETLRLMLAHAPADAVDAAYMRGQLLEKRRRFAREWGAFIYAEPTSSNVVPLERAG